MTETHYDAVEELAAAYPDLRITENPDGSVVAEGDYVLDAEYDGIRLVETFHLIISIDSSFPNSIPVVKEMSNKIPANYEHLYSNQSFCLGINGELLMELLEDPSLVSFIDGPVRSYLYTALFHQRYGRYPFEDWAHGAAGIFQFYMELFSVSSPKAAFNLIQFVKIGRYRGHLPCPCGSGVRTRNCHGDQLLEIIKSPKREIIAKDFRCIEKAFEAKLLRDDMLCKTSNNPPA